MGLIIIEAGLKGLRSLRRLRREVDRRIQANLLATSCVLLPVTELKNVEEGDC